MIYSGDDDDDEFGIADRNRRLNEDLSYRFGNQHLTDDDDDGNNGVVDHNNDDDLYCDNSNRFAGIRNSRGCSNYAETVANNSNNHHQNHSGVGLQSTMLISYPPSTISPDRRKNIEISKLRLEIEELTTGLARVELERDKCMQQVKQLQLQLVEKDAYIVNMKAKYKKVMKDVQKVVVKLYNSHAKQKVNALNSGYGGEFS